jgi:hypothetical protein
MDPILELANRIIEIVKEADCTHYALKRANKLLPTLQLARKLEPIYNKGATDWDCAVRLAITLMKNEHEQFVRPEPSLESSFLDGATR